MFVRFAAAPSQTKTRFSARPGPQGPYVNAMLSGMDRVRMSPGSRLWKALTDYYGELGIENPKMERGVILFGLIRYAGGTERRGRRGRPKDRGLTDGLYPDGCRRGGPGRRRTGVG